MNSHDQRPFVQREMKDQDMSSVPTLALVARGLVARETTRSGSPQAAKQTVARRLRMGSGSFANLIRERIKSVSADVRDRLVAAAIADLGNEITKLEHERQLLLQMGTSPDHDDMRALVGALETAREAIERMK